jgi:hypothetical protein
MEKTPCDEGKNNLYLACEIKLITPGAPRIQAHHLFFNLVIRSIYLGVGEACIPETGLEAASSEVKLGDRDPANVAPVNGITHGFALAFTLCRDRRHIYRGNRAAIV